MALPQPLNVPFFPACACVDALHLSPSHRYMCVCVFNL